MFRGSIPALITPFDQGAFDEPTFRALVDRQVASGSSALAPCGTTGESSTLSDAEREQVIGACVEQSGGAVPVIAGCGTNDTARTLYNIRRARACGAAAALVVTPYYSLPSTAGLLAHFSYLAEHGDLPIVLYNVPGRSVTDLRPDIVQELARRFPGTFIGIKDASGDLSRVSELQIALGESFCQLSGDDKLALPFNIAGGVGCISVTANVAPALCARLQEACASNDIETARELSDLLYPLHCALFADSSPGPCKYALSQVMEGFSNTLRLPLVPCSDRAQRLVDTALKRAGLIQAGYAFMN